MHAMQFRRAEPEDYPAILRIQSANYIGNMSEQERKEGFLSAEFAPKQIEAMAGDLGIIVAGESGESRSILGYLCGFRREFDHGSPVLAKMLESHDRVRYEGRPLSSYSSYLYGPVCIDRNHRRRGLLRGLYEAQIRDLAGQFDVGVAFVARNNEHSLQAHVVGLGMIDVGDFQVKGNIYAILAFSVPAERPQRFL